MMSIVSRRLHKHKDTIWPYPHLQTQLIQSL